MDSIDFNSYLPKKKERDDVKQTKRYQIYKDRVRKALKSCQDVIDNVPTEIKDFTPPENPDKNKLTQYLIFHLFEAKKIRLEVRKEITREKEEEKYKTEIYLLNVSYYKIPEEYFHGKQKNKGLEESFNWAKVLYYNEFAICYAGLTESSMSLGYAERSRSLLEEIYPKIDSLEKVKPQDVKLYTFALYNKGEAEWLLHNDNLSLRTFEKIKEIYKHKNWKEKKPSDYYSGLLRMALILIDQGRGEEAIDHLREAEFADSSDYRIPERDLEIASALIDQKKYEEASHTLEEYTENGWKHTFTQRKAVLYKIRLLLEWRKNRVEEFKNKPGLVKEFKKVPQGIKYIITQCIDRKDGDNFKKACKYFSEYHASPSVSKKDEELKGYFWYLMYETSMSKKPKDVDEFLKSNWKKLEKEIQNKRDKFYNILDKIEDEDYLSKFFKGYKEYLQKNKDRKVARKFSKIIDKLHEILCKLYREENELQKMEEIERGYIYFKDFLGAEQKRDQNVEEAIKFITEKFIKTIPPDIKRDRVYLSSNTIENIMCQNTDKFADKILGSSNPIPEGKGTNGILTVLRRWNSFTPSLSSPASPSRGGGYFLYFKDGNSKSKGIVIDPGYDFLDSLFFEGFTISDIDVVLISHAHPDHTDDFPKMLTLFHEMNEKLKEWKKKTKEYDRKHIKVILSQGVFDLFSRQMDYSKESIKDIYVVDTKKKDGPIKCYQDQIGGGKELRIEAFRTSHGDLSQWESIGFLFNIENNKQKIKIGYTSDARWSDEFGKNFSDCSVICAHLGSIVNILKNKDFCNTFCKKFQKNDNDNKCKKLDKCKKSRFEINDTNLIKQTQDENHLYLAGLTLFFDSLFKKGSNLKLGIISEFGEELKGGIRMDLYHKFDDWFQEKRKNKQEEEKNESVPRCLPGDVGLRVDIFSGNVLCQSCDRYVDRNKITPVAYGKEEAIFFVCDECKSVLSTYQIDAKLRDYYENGRKLELADESK